jgi:ABC-type xylose transport system permease subunit
MAVARPGRLREAPCCCSDCWGSSQFHPSSCLSVYRWATYWTAGVRLWIYVTLGALLGQWSDEAAAFSCLCSFLSLFNCFLFLRPVHLPLTFCHPVIPTSSFLFFILSTFLSNFFRLFLIYLCLLFQFMFIFSHFSLSSLHCVSFFPALWGRVCLSNLVHSIGITVCIPTS